MISSKSNAKIKSVKKLISSSKERKAKGLFVIEGARLVKEAPVESVEQLFVSESMEQGGEFDLSLYNNVELVSDEVFRFLSDTVTPQGILAVVRQPQWSMEGGVFDRPCRLVLLDDIQDPGNLGTILRTAEAAGIDMVIMSEGCADVFNPKVIRSTMGSIFRVPFACDDLVSVIEVLKTEGVCIYGAALEGGTDYQSIDFPDKTAIVIGNEGNGISGSVLNAVNERIFIPMEGKVESLNAAVSAAILMFHVKKKI